MSHSHTQHGLSLIELMIALLIGTFLVIGLTQVYIDNRKSYSFRQGMLENQEGTRFALLFLKRELKKAGYRRRPDIPMTEAFKSSGACSFSDGEVVKLMGTSICIRYQPRDKYDRDCLGGGVSSLNNYDEPYTRPKIEDVFVEKIELDSGGLKCTSYKGSESSSGQLVSGVVDLRFEVGVGSNDTPSKLTGYQLLAPDNDVPIVSVRFTLLQRSSHGHLRESVDLATALEQWKTFTGATSSRVSDMELADKGQLYQVVQGTAMLRNLLP